MTERVAKPAGSDHRSISEDGIAPGFVADKVANYEALTRMSMATPSGTGGSPALVVGRRQCSFDDEDGDDDWIFDQPNNPTFDSEHDDPGPDGLSDDAMQATIEPECSVLNSSATPKPWHGHPSKQRARASLGGVVSESRIQLYEFKESQMNGDVVAAIDIRLG